MHGDPQFLDDNSGDDVELDRISFELSSFCILHCASCFALVDAILETVQHNLWNDSLVLFWSQLVFDKVELDCETEPLVVLGNLKLLVQCLPRRHVTFLREKTSEVFGP